MRINKYILWTISLSVLWWGCSKEETNTEPGKEDAVYDVAQIVIITENETAVSSKSEYVKCSIDIVSETNDKWNYTCTGRIRGRGNSTWLWYPKKPYRLKLDEKSEILGLAKEKDWVLLANYRDPTHIMNAFVFVMGEKMGLPYTNHSRYVEVTLNGDYIGLYQLTEQVEQGSNRVAVEDDGGILICLDADDGPELSPEAEDNFWSTVYSLPVCVKYPEETDLTIIQNDFAELESAIKKVDYTAVCQLLNVESFIDYMIIQELIYNVEVDAPRSIYMHKSVGGRWTMGPLWDFDAGFDWSTMYAGHNYFSSYIELVLGTDPPMHTGGYSVPEFFSDMYKSTPFLAAYKSRWRAIRDDIMNVYWNETEQYVNAASEAMARNATRWPIDKNYTTEITRMKQWLKLRVAYLDSVIENY